MLALSNPFYQNPEGNARLLLQQIINNDAQRGVHQCLADIYSLRFLLSQAHLCLCFPLDSFPMPPPNPTMQPFHFFRTGQKADATHETKLHVSIGSNYIQKRICPAAKSEECKLKEDSVEIGLNMREVLPAEIHVTFEENSIRVDANRIQREGGANRFCREYHFPCYIQADAGQCILTQDGILYISVPWSKMEF